MTIKRHRLSFTAYLVITDWFCLVIKKKKHLTYPLNEYFSLFASRSLDNPFVKTSCMRGGRQVGGYFRTERVQEQFSIDDLRF